MFLPRNRGSYSNNAIYDKWPSASFLQYNINTTKAFILFTYLFFVTDAWWPQIVLLDVTFFLSLIRVTDDYLHAREKIPFAVCDSSTVPTAANKSVIWIKKWDANKQSH